MSGRHSRGWALALVVVLTGMGLGAVGGIADGPPGTKGPETVFAIVAVGAVFFALLRGPVGKAIAKMLESDRTSGEEDIASRMYELESRVAESTLDEQRIAELEERLDFAERLLAQRNEAVHLPLHRTPV